MRRVWARLRALWVQAGLVRGGSAPQPQTPAAIPFRGSGRLRPDAAPPARGTPVSSAMRPIAAALAAWTAILIGIPGLVRGQGAPPAPPPAGPTVVEIEIQGLKRNDRAVVEGKMQLKQGQPFSSDTLQEDVKRLYASGLFSNIEAHQETLPGGIRLVLRLTENEVIEDITFPGMKEFHLEDVLDELHLRKYETFNEHFLNLDVETLKAKYTAKGFNFVSIEAHERAGLRGLVVEFAVREGPQVGVEEVVLEGVEQVDPDDVRDIMKIQEDHWWTSSRFNNQDLEEDLLRVRAWYRGEGFLDVETQLADLKFSPDKESAYVTIVVREGGRYTLQAVRFEGNTLFTAEQLQSLMRLKAGEPFRLRLLERDVNTLKDAYGSRAYIGAEVRPEYTVDDQAHTAVLALRIVEGPKTVTGRVLIRGNTKTQDKVIRRNIGVYPGEDLNLVALRRSVERLQGTRYFDPATVDLLPTEKPNERDVIFDVTETTTGSARVGAGFSSNFGLIGMIDFEQRNFDIADLPKSWDDLFGGEAFVGAGQSLGISLQPGINRSAYSINFREPWLFDEPVGFNLSLFSLERDRKAFQEARLGAGFGFDYRFENGWVPTLGFRFERIKITDVDNDAPKPIQDIAGTNALHTVSLGLGLDRRDSIMLPSRGYKLSSAVESAGLLGGDIDFIKMAAGAEWYKTLFTTETGGKHVIGLSGKIGYVAATGGSTDVPVFERFYLGGAGSLRGFKYRGVTPEENGDPIGGKGMASVNFEYSFPLYRTEYKDNYTDMLRGVLFCDTGSVATDFSEITPDNWRVAVGFGVRFIVPQFGNVPVALDFGIPIKKEDDDETQIVSFNLGTAF